MTITIISTSNCEHSVAPSNDLDVAHVDTNVKLLAGIYRSASEDWYEEPLEKGVKLVLLQSGQLRCSVSGQPEQRMSGPHLCFIANDSDCTTRQAYSCATPLRYIIVQLGLEVFDADRDMLPKSLRPLNGDPRLISCPANRALQALAAQIATCSLQGGARSLYLGGKALELAALSTQLLTTQDKSGRAALHITSSDIERVYAARDILFEALQDPPTLGVLAARVGTNPRKLTEGFRKVFGSSVFSLLTEHRLHVAHRMLCDEEANVSTVAYRVGYSPAHFSVAFRKRYGVSPSDIRTVGHAG